MAFWPLILIKPFVSFSSTTWTLGPQLSLQDFSSNLTTDGDEVGVGPMRRELPRAGVETGVETGVFFLGGIDRNRTNSSI